MIFWPPVIFLVDYEFRLVTKFTSLAGLQALFSSFPMFLLSLVYVKDPPKQVQAPRNPLEKSPEVSNLVTKGLNTYGN